MFLIGVLAKWLPFISADWNTSKLKGAWTLVRFEDCGVPFDVTSVGVTFDGHIASVSAEGVVDLIWNANAEADLAGYLILRADAPGEKLARLTPAPITETTYRDTTVEPGRTYVYAVAAVDKAAKPNVSGYSNEVTQVVR